jgi:hypothetical protein
MSSQEGHLEKTHALEVTHNASARLVIIRLSSSTESNAPGLNTPLSEAKVTSEPEASASAPNEETQDQTNNLISETLVRRCLRCISQICTAEMISLIDEISLSKLEGLEQSVRPNISQESQFEQSLIDCYMSASKARAPLPFLDLQRPRRTGLGCLHRQSLSRAQHFLHTAAVASWHGSR